MQSKITFNIDENQLEVFVMKVFPTNVSQVWNHFSNSELIDEWWAPKPWKCETQQMNFENGGNWLYAMVSPEGEKHYAAVDYNDITFHRSISWMDYFCDENGTKNSDFPSVSWLIGFTGVEEGTKLTVNIHFNSLENMKQLLEMGFEEGFKMGLNQLEDLLKS